MQRDGRDDAVLGKCDGGFGGDAGAGGCRVDDEDERFVECVGDVDGGADGAKIVRAGARGHDDQIGALDNMRDRLRDGGRRVDDDQLEADRLQVIEAGVEFFE